MKKKSTENYVGIPYVTTLLSTSLWTFYGLLKPGGLLVATVNGAGAALQFIYVTLFLIYSPKDKKVLIVKQSSLIPHVTYIICFPFIAKFHFLHSMLYDTYFLSHKIGKTYLIGPTKAKFGILERLIGSQML